MILEESRYQSFLECISDPVEYSRLVFFLKHSRESIDKIHTSSDEMESAVVLLKESGFDDRENALLYMNGSSEDYSFLANFIYRTPLHFRCVPQPIFNYVKKPWKIEDFESFGLWYIDDDSPIGLNFPGGYKVEQIRESDIREVNDNWAFGRGKVSQFIRKQIQNRNTFAIYIDDKIASYALFRENGSMGMLRTLPEYRNMGLAKILTAEMVKSARDRGWAPHCYIAHDNFLSQRVTKNSGFCFYSSQYWFIKK